MSQLTRDAGIDHPTEENPTRLFSCPLTHRTVAIGGEGDMARPRAAYRPVANDPKADMSQPSRR